MGMFTNTNNREEYEDIYVNMEELTEAFFYDDHYADSDYDKQQLLENSDYLTEANKISRKTIVKLNKNDDLTRRTSMTALQLAKDNNDPLWKALVKNRIQERKLLAKIHKKYASKATIVAKQAQKQYISGTGTTKQPNVKKMSTKEMSRTRF